MPSSRRFRLPDPAAETGRFRKQDRLVTVGEFRRTYARGYHSSSPRFGCYVLPRRDRRIRLGVSVSKKYGNSPERNRLKRVVREAFRRVRDQIGKPCDIVIVARRGAHGASMQVVAREVVELVAQALASKRKRPPRPRGKRSR